MRKFAIVAALLAIFISITIYTFLNVYEHTTGWAAFGVAITGFLPLLLAGVTVSRHEEQAGEQGKAPQHERDRPSRLPQRPELRQIIPQNRLAYRYISTGFKSYRV